MRPQHLLSIIAILTVFLQQSVIGAALEPLTNTVGMNMIPIQAGEFQMGELNPTPPEKLGHFELLPDGDWDEHPARKVTITNGFYLSETEVTIEQFRQFHPDYKGTDRCAPYVCNISWNEATAFCEWLSKKEGKPYRLPTEAEWEYACRAGTTTLFSSGDLPPESDTPNPWGLKNMHQLPTEWCLDWHEMYPDFDETDPDGPETGVARVIRGGGIQIPDSPYYLRSANRAGLPPEYPFSGDESARMGNGVIPVGFRVAMAPVPKSAVNPPELPFPVQCVKQSTNYVKQGPDPEKPYFTMRPLLPIPPDNDQADDRLAAGIHPAVLGHNHSPGMTVCSNGDVLACFFTSSTNKTEYKPNVCFMMTRLRFGSEQWDMPELFYDFPDAAEQSALLWNDQGTLYLFTGGVDLPGVPFRWSKSEDHGATWSRLQLTDEIKPLETYSEDMRRSPVLHLPLIHGPVGSYSPQPINSAFRLNGTIFMASDGEGGTSLLWASDNNGETWYDTGGRTGGRHTTFVPLSDGRILGLGGKNTDIDGYMPQSISSDRGKTWEVSRTVFAALAFNQRPTVIRLQSGRLFFASDFQSTTNKQPQGITERGSFVALSDDEGKTWHIKRLDAAQ
nr:SUMF1/EgtB/PvdO family nonheme iron enzyme [bacterium]